MRYGTILIILFVFSGTGFSLVFHPNSEPDDSWQDRPSNAIAARIGICSGTVIGPQHVLTVAHYTVNLSTPIEVDKRIYYPEEIYTHPLQDIRLIKVAEANFQDYAEIPTIPVGADNQDCVMVISGWGKSRGNNVYATTAPDIVVGYTWSSDYGTLRWGTSKITGYSESQIHTRFEATDQVKGTPYECALATYDSGCGMFFPQNGHWMLAALGCKVSDFGYDFFRHPDDPNKIYGTLNIYLQTQPFNGWIRSIMYGADITEDGRIDIADLLSFQEEWLCRDEDFNPRADLNRDGIVNNADFSLLAANWSSVLSPTIPPAF